MGNAVGDQILESAPNEPQEEYWIDTIKPDTLHGDEKNIVLANFLNSLRYGNDLFKLIDKDNYYPAYTKYIENLLQRPESIIRFARLEDTILGWSLTENKILHYIWVKKEARRQGIGRSLLPKEFDSISHITNIGVNIWVSKFTTVRFNPFV